MESRRDATTVLVLGAGGTFGRRVVELLVADGRFAVLCASRDGDRARAVASGLGAPAGVEMARPEDAEAGASKLRSLGVRILIDASGPFQAYGQDRYVTATAASRAGAHYLDLADDPAFVNGTDVLDAEAKAAGVFVRSGASTPPPCWSRPPCARWRPRSRSSRTSRPESRPRRA